MNIIGLDALIFGVDDIQACTDCLRDYGLEPIAVSSEGGRLEALDGTAVIIRRADDPGLPAAIGPAPSIRETVYGVASAADLDAIEDELARDRQVSRENGVLHSVDDMGRPVDPRPAQRVAPPFGNRRRRAASRQRALAGGLVEQRRHPPSPAQCGARAVVAHRRAGRAGRAVAAAPGAATKAAR